ncbi:hypothetical protein [Halobacterium rubrum]|uniref:hypothetical protein n=1 Tax=Halobacterium TaxID=2239 RepID=UPI001F29E99D|nr:MULTISPECIES: hypothetical protein [Halobacterium]MDH5020339.1 hypothetical protein [Halobacterium rubrum]
MPRRIIDHRERDLTARFDHLQDEITRFSDLSVSDSFDSRFTKIDEIFDDIDRRRSDVEANPDVDPLYQRYLSKVLSAEANIAELELVLTHLELYSNHRDHSRDRICHVRNICDELTDSFGLTATCLPVIRENYSLLPLLDNEYYVIYIPRGQDIIPTTPILAHEVAHAILDQRSARSDQQSARSDDFTERFGELRRQMSTARAERDFYENWDYWYDELFCDVAGFFAFGPSYVCAQLHHLLTRRPYNIIRNVRVEDEYLHPPEALRAEVVTTLADEYLPDELLESLEHVRDEYTEHLERTINSKPSFYDQWVDDQLVDAVVSDAESVNDDLDNLCQHLLNGTDYDEAPDFEYRLKANQYWLDEY